MRSENAAGKCRSAAPQSTGGTQYFREGHVVSARPQSPAARLTEIFSTFVQLDQSTTRRHEGLGLGLAVSRALARAMSGDLKAESQEGIGTTVTVRLNAATG